MADLESSGLVKRNCPVLGECASQIADPLVRNMGTIGGNICHADPLNDMPAVMIASGAEMIAEGPKGERRIVASDFFRDAFTTALKEEEVLKEVRLPIIRTKASAYAKLERQAGDFGIVGVAVCLQLSTAGIDEECGIGLTGVGPFVIAARRAEDVVRGTKIDGRVISRAAELAAEDSNPVGDLRGSVEYKREMVKVMTRKALTLALKRGRIV